MNASSLVDKWAFFFREAKHLEVVPSALAAAPFRDALDVARATFSPAEWDAYERSKMAEQDARPALALAVRDGEARGRGEGKPEGKAAAVRPEGLPSPKTSVRPSSPAPKPTRSTDGCALPLPSRRPSSSSPEGPRVTAGAAYLRLAKASAKLVS